MWDSNTAQTAKDSDFFSFFPLVAFNAVNLAKRGQETFFVKKKGLVLEKVSPFAMRRLPISNGNSFSIKRHKLAIKTQIQKNLCYVRHVLSFKYAFVAFQIR